MTETDPGSRREPAPIEPLLIEFASGLAHELSNALTSVGLHADMARLLLERGEHENALRMIARVQDEFRRNIDLMNALRRFAGAPNELAPASIRMAALVTEARECACLMLDSSPESIRIGTVDPAADVVVDREAMIHVIVQLIRNALEAGANRVTLDAGCEGRGWHVAIGDDGPGIEAAIRARLFEMFASSRRQQGHLGLGLWAVERICTAHGLRVRAREGKGAGATFIIESVS